jgi:hypothetical protein
MSPKSKSGGGGLGVLLTSIKSFMSGGLYSREINMAPLKLWQVGFIPLLPLLLFWCLWCFEGLPRKDGWRFVLVITNIYWRYACTFTSRTWNEVTTLFCIFHASLTFIFNICTYSISHTLFYSDIHFVKLSENRWLAWRLQSGRIAYTGIHWSSTIEMGYQPSIDKLQLLQWGK